MMMTLLITTLLAGMVLGQRFKVLILLPGITVVVIAAVAMGIARAEHLRLIALMAVGAAAALQVGYLLGTAIRAFLVAARAARIYRSPVAAPAPARIRRATHQPQ
jgi:membrane protein DedA with SNARE-associated domain